jgi:hypothetical protein
MAKAEFNKKNTSLSTNQLNALFHFHFSLFTSSPLGNKGESEKVHLNWFVDSELLKRCTVRLI